MKVHGIDLEQLLDFLKGTAHGERNSIVGRDLIGLFGGNSRSIREAITQIRLNGHPVGSGAHGYYYCETAEELDSAVGYCWKKIDGLLAVADALTTEGRAKLG